MQFATGCPQMPAHGGRVCRNGGELARFFVEFPRFLGDFLDPRASRLVEGRIPDFPTRRRMPREVDIASGDFCRFPSR